MYKKMIDDKINILEKFLFLKSSNDLEMLYFKSEIKNGNKYTNIIDNIISMDDLKFVQFPKRPPNSMGLLIKKRRPGIDKTMLNKQKNIIFLKFVFIKIIKNK